MQYTLLIQCNLHTAYTIKCLYNDAYTPYTILHIHHCCATCIFTKGWTRARSTLCHRPTLPDSSGKQNSEARLGDGVSTTPPRPHADRDIGTAGRHRCGRYPSAPGPSAPGPSARPATLHYGHPSREHGQAPAAPTHHIPCSAALTGNNIAHCQKQRAETRAAGPPGARNGKSTTQKLRNTHPCTRAPQKHTHNRYHFRALPTPVPPFKGPPGPQGPPIAAPK